MEEEIWYSEKYQNCLRDMGHILSRLVPTMTRFERAVVKDLGFTPSQANLLLMVSQNPDSTMSDIARYLGLDESTLTRNGGRLMDGGLLVKSRDISDRRVYRLNLTPEGQKRAILVQEQINHLYRKVIEKLPPGHVREVMAAVEHLELALNNALGEWTET